MDECWSQGWVPPLPPPTLHPTPPPPTPFPIAPNSRVTSNGTIRDEVVLILESSIAGYISGICCGHRQSKNQHQDTTLTHVSFFVSLSHTLGNVLYVIALSFGYSQWLSRVWKFGECVFYGGQWTNQRRAVENGKWKFNVIAESSCAVDWINIFLSKLHFLESQPLYTEREIKKEIRIYGGRLNSTHYCTQNFTMVWLVNYFKKNIFFL